MCVREIERGRGEREKKFFFKGNCNFYLARGSTIDSASPSTSELNVTRVHLARSVSSKIRNTWEMLKTEEGIKRLRNHFTVQVTGELGPTKKSMNVRSLSLSLQKTFFSFFFSSSQSPSFFFSIFLSVCYSLNFKLLNWDRIFILLKNFFSGYYIHVSLAIISLCLLTVYFYRFLLPYFHFLSYSLSCFSDSLFYNS